MQCFKCNSALSDPSVNYTYNAYNTYKAKCIVLNMIVVIVFTKTLFLYFLHSSPMIIYAQPQIQNVTSLKTAETHEHV